MVLDGTENGNSSKTNP